MMEISPYNSKKIAILNSVAIVLVLLLHSYFLEAADYPVVQTVQLFTGTNGISGVAVPLFYFISGVLFFKSVNRVMDCISGIRKRIRSLLVPYIIWNVIFVGWYLVMSMIPRISGFVNSDMLSHFSINTPFASLDYLLLEPAGFHLWFLRDLILYVLVSPLIYVACKRFPLVALLLFLVLFGWINRCGLPYFSAGAVVAMHYGLDIFDKGLFKSKAVRFILLTLFGAKCIMTMMPSCDAILHNPYFQQIANMAGIILVWWGYDVMFRAFSTGTLEKTLLYISKYSFFIYLFHEPALNIIKKLGLFILGVDNMSLLVLYLVSPILMTAIAIGVAIIIKNIVPKLYSIAVGGR